MSAFHNINPKITIVMAVYNGSRFLKEQIESIRRQTYEAWNMVAVDDVSSDESFLILGGYASADPRIKAYQNRANVGFVKNFLNALAYADGDLICYADQDDIWRPDKLETLASLMRDPGTALAYSDLEVCDEQMNRIHDSFWRLSGIRPRKGKLQEFSILRNIMPGCSMMFTKRVRDALLELLPQSSFLHDHLAFILGAVFGKVRFSAKPLVRYRQHPNNSIGAFYPSVSNREFFRQKTYRELEALRPYLSFDSSDLECFLSEKKPGLLKRLKMLRFYLWLRRDRLQDKCLGLAECLAPDFYACCKGRL